MFSTGRLELLDTFSIFSLSYVIGTHSNTIICLANPVCKGVSSNATSCLAYKVWALGTWVGHPRDLHPYSVNTGWSCDSTNLSPCRFGAFMPLAATYFPTPLPGQYRRRWGVSLPCSRWVRVVPPCQNHQRRSKCS